MKQFACTNVVPGCEAVASGETEADVLAAVAAHAREAHGIEEVSPELAAAVSTNITDA
jgi:predicted small metal-binding protein